ncbi:cinnamoyl-CoA reductase [Penicillium verrucosum]|uniref:cinnamoyl-CoA reductase n=1 Tax=Penicillium verrucosum TaxID=60171 RepID=UPI002544FCB7|nr:cinnamoyl-CoA reductase [Penicillium verrucosum]KAJ5941770.1 cinnamoyl-CoA reductase [Penicillium verrucosum]
MDDKAYALPPSSRVLVTGANGYLASQIIDLLLSRGYLVRGQVRQHRQWLNEHFKGKYGDLFESVILSELDDREGIAPLLDDVDGVILVAMDMSFEDDPTIVEKTVKRTLTWLEVAAESPSVKRVVLTSSASAYSFNSEAVAAVQNNTPEIPGMMGASLYAASKTEGEREAVKWVENHKPSFVFNRVVPYWCLGPRVHPEAGGPMGSMGMTSALVKGYGDFMYMFPPMWYVSVKDAAYLHIAALLHPDIKSERIFAMAAPFNWTEVVEIIRKIQPDNHKIPGPPADEGRCLHEFVEVSRGKKLLQEFCGQPGWTSLEDCLVAGLPTYE